MLSAIKLIFGSSTRLCGAHSGAECRPSIFFPPSRTKRLRRRVMSNMYFSANPICEMKLLLPKSTCSTCPVSEVCAACAPHANSACSHGGKEWELPPIFTTLRTPLSIPHGHPHQISEKSNIMVQGREIKQSHLDDIFSDNGLIVFTILNRGSGGHSPQEKNWPFL